MKKIICSLLTVVILFNFILCNNSYATDESAKFDGATTADISNSVTGKSLDKLMNEGTVEDSPAGPLSIVWDVMGHPFATIAGIITAVINIFPMVIQVVMMIMIRRK